MARDQLQRNKTRHQIIDNSQTAQQNILTFIRLEGNFFAKSFSSNIDVAGGAIYHLDTMLTFVHNIR